MPSPVFISKPSAFFSMPVILRGAQFAVVGCYRSLQNSNILRSDYTVYLCAQLVKLQVVLYMTTNVPLFLITRYHGQDSQFIFLVKFLINPNIFLLTFSSFFQNTFDNVFLFNLKFIDSKNGSHFYNHLAQIENADLMKDTSHEFWLFPSFEQFKKHLKSSQSFKAFLRRYMSVVFSNVLMFCLIILPNRYTSIILSFTTFHTFHHRVGSGPCLLLTAFLNILPPHYTALVLTAFYSCENLAQDFLLPFMHRVNPTNNEISHWLNSRGGALFGFSFVYYFLINYFPSLSVAFYLLGSLNMSYLLTKLSNSSPPEIPEQQKPSTLLISWFSQQLIWSGHSDFAQGKWIDDSFNPVPGSFIFE